MRPLAAAADTNSHEVILREFSDTVNMFVLTATVESHMTIPTGATRVILNGTAAYYTKIGGVGTTASIPVADVTNGSGCPIQAAGYALKVTDSVISCISPAACIVSLEFFS